MKKSPSKDLENLKSSKETNSHFLSKIITIVPEIFKLIVKKTLGEKIEDDEIKEQIKQYLEVTKQGYKNKIHSIVVRSKKDDYIVKINKYFFDNGGDPNSKDDLEKDYLGAYISTKEKISKSNLEKYEKHKKGNVLCSSGNYEEAIKMYNKAIELDPEYVTAYYNKGSALYNLGKYEEAIEMFNKAIELNPEFQEAYYNKGNALFELGEQEKEKRNIEEMIKKYEEAIEMFNKAIELNPENADAYYDKGIILYRLSILDKSNKKLNMLYKLYFLTYLLFNSSNDENFSLLDNFNKDFGNEISKNIKEFIENQDFEGLREYLFSFEEK